MSAIDHAALRKLYEEATPIPWRELPWCEESDNASIFACENSRIATVWSAYRKARKRDANGHKVDEGPYNLALIVAAVNALPALLDENERLSIFEEVLADEIHKRHLAGSCDTCSGTGKMEVPTEQGPEGEVLSTALTTCLDCDGVAGKSELARLRARVRELEAIAERVRLAFQGPMPKTPAEWNAHQQRVLDAINNAPPPAGESEKT